MRAVRPVHAAVVGAIGVVGLFALEASSAGVRSGGISGFSGRTGPTCNQCHSGGIAPTVALSGPTTVNVGEQNTYTFTITGGQKRAGGLDVSATLGTMMATEGGTRILAGELTHSTPRDAVGDVVTFSFDWLAPAQAGTALMFGAGNSVNRNFSTSGDESDAVVLSIDVLDCAVTFSTFGNGLAGSGGFVPQLDGTDGPCSGGYSLDISQGLGAAPAFLFAGVGTAPGMLFGGDFYIDFALPFTIVPFALAGPPGVPGAGGVSLPGPDVSAFAGLTFFVQVALADPGAVFGVSLTNAMEMKVGP